MTQEEIKKVEELDEHYRLYLNGEFSCTKCKETIKHSDCKGCPIYVSHFEND